MSVLVHDPVDLNGLNRPTVELVIQKEEVIEKKEEVAPSGKDEVIKAIKEAFPKNYGVMLEIARCESAYGQNKEPNKNIRAGKVWSADHGVFQINDYYHQKTAEKMGIDIHTIEGNIKYARYLYDKNGYRDWSASRGCWYK